MTFKSLLNSLAKKFGYEIIPAYALELKRFPLGMPDKQKQMISKLDNFTMSSYISIAVLIDAIQYLIKNNIPGDIVECGIGKGGAVMSIAETLVDLKNFERKIFLYDTYEGFPEPSQYDINYKNENASTIKQKELKKEITWGLVANLDQVKENVFSTKYPKEKFNFIKGKVEETIPKHS